ncbi:MAG: glutaminyl-peptide cyclotransferase [Tenacibaculum sp.]|nr:glutaminyl-peptide cyclotransferase [Tenacibaculum sp.]
MTLLKQITSILVILITLISCSKNDYKFKIETPKKTTLGKKETISFKQTQGDKIDSVNIYVNGKLITKNNTFTFNTLNYGVGKYNITALAFTPNEVKKVKNYIEVFADTAPTLYSYKIVNVYPHDKNAFTQGLEYYNGFLYETTGRHGKSWLRKVNLKTGEILKQTDLPKEYFGEGMTIFNNKIHWLTWQKGKGFVYNLSNFKNIGEFKYNKSIEGWGLTHNSTHLIKSDGSNKIWFLNPETLKEEYYIQAYTNKLSLEQLNELELINGKIYANYWQKPLIAIINPKNGVVEGIINLTGLVKEMEKTQKLVDQDEVLNGIAFDVKNNRIFVTGKHWGKLFEIELVKNN